MFARLGWDVPKMPVFLTFFSIALKDERVTPLVLDVACSKGLKDRTHRWKDWYFFVAVGALGLERVPG